MKQNYFHLNVCGFFFVTCLRFLLMTRFLMMEIPWWHSFGLIIICILNLGFFTKTMFLFKCILNGINFELLKAFRINKTYLYYDLFSFCCNMWICEYKKLAKITINIFHCFHRLTRIHKQVYCDCTFFYLQYLCFITIIKFYEFILCPILFFWSYLYNIIPTL